jgi:hypothetical protein
MDPRLARLALWSYDDNYTGWHALLGDRPSPPAASSPRDRLGASRSRPLLR